MDPEIRKKFEEKGVSHYNLIITGIYSDLHEQAMAINSYFYRQQVFYFQDLNQNL